VNIPRQDNRRRDNRPGPCTAPGLVNTRDQLDTVLPEELFKP
jgi:hypothetical protein